MYKKMCVYVTLLFAFILHQTCFNSVGHNSGGVAINSTRYESYELAEKAKTKLMQDKTIRNYCTFTISDDGFNNNTK